MKKIFAIAAAIVLLASCVGKGEYNAQVSKVDSLQAVCANLAKANAELQTELEGYKFSPSRLLANIRDCYKEKSYGELKRNLDLMKQYHPDAQEMTTANGIYEQGVKEQEAARKKADAEAAKREAERRAKMKPIERIMEKYDCDEETATLIHQRRVRMGMTREQARAAWGRPRDINRSVGSYGVHEQWCYNGSYLYFEDGILTSWQN